MDYGQDVRKFKILTKLLITYSQNSKIYLQIKLLKTIETCVITI